MRFKVLQHQKLVSFLQKELDPHLSKKQVRKLLDANFCRVNGIVERFGTADVEKGAVVELNKNWQSLLEKKKESSIEILYEDEYFLAIHKPQGFVCSDSECKKKFGSLSRNSERNQVSLIHRLDKDTTGVLLIAKSLDVKNRFIELFQSFSIEKRYLAIVDKIVKAPKGVCKSFFSKKGSFQGQTIWGSSTQGLYAETNWNVVSRGKNASLIECIPVTGRTHQIRVHLAEMKHPILTDRHYCKTFTSPFFAQRYLLHAKSVSFLHPFLSIPIEIHAPLPKDFNDAIQKLEL